MGELPTSTPHPTDAAAATVHAQMRAGAVPAIEPVEHVAALTVLPQLQTRVVREARRETWFVVNETGEELATIPIELTGARFIRRVQVNGEVAEFSASPDLVLVRPRRILRAGAGTIVVIHFR